MLTSQMLLFFWGRSQIRFGCRACRGHGRQVLPRTPMMLRSLSRSRLPWPSTTTTCIYSIMPWTAP
eukprot:5526768-Pyramimonas_sp.AAC.1